MLDAESSWVAHAIQNLALIFLSVCLIPLSTAVLLIGGAINLVHTPRAAAHRKHVRRTSHQPRTILVTGVGMSKGLALARCFYTAGHDVVGADFQRTSCGRVSTALKAYHRLPKPDGTPQGQDRYVQAMMQIIVREQIDLWVSCSGVASAAEDGMLADHVVQHTTCKVVQFDLRTTQRLHEKHSFMDYTRSLGLRIPQTHTVTSKADVLMVLQAAASSDQRYIMKFVGVDDLVRGDMTLLPLASPLATRSHIEKLDISKSRPWILQQFIRGPEFCTHSLVVRGQVKAFVACPSSELLMHYSALPADSALSRSMLRFTHEFAAAADQSFTGHLSFDFLVEQDEVDASWRDPLHEVKLYPIECNPRVHTAVVLFQNTPELVGAYLSVLEPNKITQPNDPNIKPRDPIFARNSKSYYWIGHDLMEMIIMPLIMLLARNEMNTWDVLRGLRTFTEHVAWWADGTYEIWDPLPAWFLYHVYWPMEFSQALWHKSKWSRINVSTCKTFPC